MRSPAATPSSIRLASWRSPSAVSRFTRPISFRYIRTVSEVPPLESVRSVLGGRTGRGRRLGGTTSSSTSTAVAEATDGRPMVAVGHQRHHAVHAVDAVGRRRRRLVHLDDADALAGEGDLDGLEHVVGELDVLQDLHDLLRVELAAAPDLRPAGLPRHPRERTPTVASSPLHRSHAFPHSGLEPP